MKTTAAAPDIHTIMLHGKMGWFRTDKGHWFPAAIYEHDGKFYRYEMVLEETRIIRIPKKDVTFSTKTRHVQKQIKYQRYTWHLDNGKIFYRYSDEKGLERRYASNLAWSSSEYGSLAEMLRDAMANGVKIGKN